MAFNKQKIQKALEDGFARIESEASENNPATKIVAEVVAAAIQTALADAEVRATVQIDGETINITGTIQ